MVTSFMVGLLIFIFLLRVIRGWFSCGIGFLALSAAAELDRAEARGPNGIMSYTAASNVQLQQA